MLSFEDVGQPIAKIMSGKFKDEILSVLDDETEKTTAMGTPELNLHTDTLVPLINPLQREVAYIAGPSGSGKSVYSSMLVKSFKAAHPEGEVYLFSRTPYKDDPAYVDIKPLQIELDETLITEPIDLAEIKQDSLVIFDDTNTVPDEKIRKKLEELMADIMEVGRKLRIWIIITNHLVNPNERKFARTVMNEMQTFTFFPRSGSAYQIKYCLDKYFGMPKTTIDRILKLKSRWVTVKKTYPQCVIYKNGVFMI